MKLLSRFLLFFWTAAVSVGTAGDWPQWRGPNRDAISNEKGLLKTWPTGGPKLAWRASGLGDAYSSVVIGNGLAFTIGKRGKDVFCTALDIVDGKPRWITKVGETSRMPCSTPTLDGELIYVVDPDGDLVCLKSATGEIVWQKSFLKDFAGRMMSGRGYGESPLIDGDRIICTPGGPKAMMVAMNKRTGKVIWQASIPEIGSAGRDGHGFSSIVVSEAAGIRQYVQLTGRGLIGIAAQDGRFLWGYNHISNQTANIPTPVVHDDLVFSANGYNAGSVLLRLKSDGQNGVAAEEVYSLGGNRFQNHHGGYLLLDGHIFGGHGSNNGLPTCLNLETGRIRWKRRGPGIGSASILYADGRLYFHYQNGLVALIEATPKGYRLHGTFSIPGAGGDSWAHPALAHGQLYLREKDHLWVYDVREQGNSPSTNEVAGQSNSAPLHPLYQYLSSADHDVVTITSEKIDDNGTIAEETLQTLRKRKRPFILHAAGTPIGDRGLEQAATLPGLVGLNLELCSEFSDAGMKHLQQTSRLEVVILTGTNVSAKGIEQLTSLPNLSAIDLEVCEQVSDDSCEVLAEVKQLRALSLKKTGFEPIRVSDDGLKSLTELPKLEWLNLTGNKVTDAGLKHLASMKQLRELDLSLLAITDKGIEHLQDLPNLRRIEMLYSTGFAGPFLTDATAKTLGQIGTLRSLNLIGSRITDTGLKQLQSLTQLESLELIGSRITNDGMTSFRKALPKCRTRHSVPSAP